MSETEEEPHIFRSEEKTAYIYSETKGKYNKQKAFSGCWRLLFCIELIIINNSDSGAIECLLNEVRPGDGTCHLSTNIRMDMVNLECIFLFLRENQKI